MLYKKTQARGISATSSDVGSIGLMPTTPFAGLQSAETSPKRMREITDTLELNNNLMTLERFAQRNNEKIREEDEDDEGGAFA